MGLRHRLRRSRPGPVERSRREHPRARHRGVLQHRRSGVEGDAPRRGREVRSGRQVVGKKDLGAIARSYGNVYVAQIAIGSNDLQATKAMVEAEAWPGPSLVIAYSTCIAHGIEMSTSMSHQKDAVRSGYWPLYRFSPSAAEDGTPFQLDSKAPTIPVSEFVASEARFAILARTNPERAAELGALLQGDADERWRYYSQLATSSAPSHTATPVDFDAVERRSRGRNERTHDRSHDPYLGLTLRTPIVASAGPLTREVDPIRRLVDAGASAIVLPSLFEEEILLEERSSTQRSWPGRTTSQRRSTTSPTPCSPTTRRSTATSVISRPCARLSTSP